MAIILVVYIFATKVKKINKKMELSKGLEVGGALI